MDTASFVPVEKTFTSFVKSSGAPGCGFAVFRDGVLAHAWFSGETRVGSGVKPSMESIVRIASMTKSFAAAAVLALRDDGKLSLGDSPAKWVPELRHERRWEKVSLHQLLSMQAGLPSDDPWADRTLTRDDEGFSTLFGGAVSWAALPGLEYHYSNFGYSILGRVISGASRAHALHFISERFLAPLEMTSSGWMPRDPGRAATGYRRFKESALEVRTIDGCGDGAVFGGLWSSLPDLGRWIAFLMSDADSGPLSQSSRSELQRAVRLVPGGERATNGAPLPPSGYAFGLKQWYSGGTWVTGHSGGLPGWSSHMRWSADHGIAIAAFTNLTYAPVWTACENALELLMERSAPRPRPPSPLVRQRFEELRSLFGTKADDGELERLFASNFFLDEDRAAFRERLEAIPANGELRVEGRRGLTGEIFAGNRPLLTFSLAPQEGAKIQSVTFESPAAAAPPPDSRRSGRSKVQKKG